jgi:hypothetical protein
MALTLSELQATTDYWVDTQPEDIFSQSNVLLHYLLGNKGFGKGGDFVTGGDLVDGGYQLQCILEYDEANAGAYGNNSVMPTDKVEIYNAARFPWAAYYAQLTISMTDKRENAGDEAWVNLIKGRLRNAAGAIRNSMGTQIYNQRSSNTGPQGETDVGFVGLGDLFNTTTSTTYGGIAEDDMSNWKANVTTTSEAISTPVIQALKRSATLRQDKAGKPNLYITTDLLKDAYENTLHLQARYQNTKLAEAGFENIEFHGNPIVVDDRQTTGYLDALNTRVLMIKTHRDANFTRPIWHSGGATGQPDTEVAYIRWWGQLLCKNRKAHARHTNLTAPS